MALPAHSYQRLIEDAVVALLTADTTGVNQAYTDAEGTSYSPTILRAYKASVESTCLAIVVHGHDLQNAMLGATGMGSQWRVTVSVSVISPRPHDPDNDNADRVQGAVERYMAALTIATLNTQLSGSGITVHGKTSAEEADIQDEDHRLQRTSAVVLHFGV